jgi:integrase
MASLEYRGDSVRITWLLGGRRGGAKQSCTFNGPEEARLKLAEAAKALVEARNHDVTRDECYEAILGTPALAEEVMPTFALWARQWLKEVEASGRLQSDVFQRYKRSLELRSVPYLGHKRLADITMDDVKAWVAHMRSSRMTYGNKNRRTGSRLLKASTVGMHFMVLQSCLHAAVPKWLTVNPAVPQPGDRRNVFGLPQIGPPEGMFLSAEEVQRILDHCSPQIYDLVFLASRTGLRIGELLALEVRHVVFPQAGGATVLVRQALKSNRTVGVPKSPASKRDVPVKGQAAEILSKRTKGRRMAALVFPTVTGRIWDPNNLRVRLWWAAIAAASCCPEHPPAPRLIPAGRRSRPVRQADYPVSTCGCPGVLSRWPRFHDLRHTHASVLVSQGWHFKKIQRRLGHARFQTTMDRYAHLADLGDEQELEGLEDFFNPPPATASRGLRARVRRRAVARTLAVRRVAA